MVARGKEGVTHTHQNPSFGPSLVECIAVVSLVSLVSLISAIFAQDQFDHFSLGTLYTVILTISCLPVPRSWVESISYRHSSQANFHNVVMYLGARLPA